MTEEIVEREHPIAPLPSLLKSFFMPLSDKDDYFLCLELLVK